MPSSTALGECGGAQLVRCHEINLSEKSRAGYNLTGIPFERDLQIMTAPCSHPRVRIVSRDEDAEYVECEDCREVFDSGEFRDMEIESKEEPPEDE
jgi:hypothetical protein